LLGIAKQDGFSLVNDIDDTLTYALFPQAGLKFLKNRNNPGAFEPAPSIEQAAPQPQAAAVTDAGVYTVEVEGKAYVVKITEGGDVSQLTESSVTVAPVPAVAAPPAGGGGKAIPAPLAGNVFKVIVDVGDVVAEGDVILVLEAMKMETEIRSPASGTVTEVNVKAGDAVKVGDSLLALG